MFDLSTTYIVWLTSRLLFKILPRTHWEDFFYHAAGQQGLAVKPVVIVFFGILQSKNTIETFYLKKIALVYFTGGDLSGGSKKYLIELENIIKLEFI